MLSKALLLSFEAILGTVAAICLCSGTGPGFLIALGLSLVLILLVIFKNSKCDYICRPEPNTEEENQND